MRTTMLIAACLLTASMAAAQSVTFDYDRSANFAAFRTYAWVKGTAVGDPLIDQRIMQAIDAQLALKGLTKVSTTAGAAVLVAYHTSFDKDLEVTGFASGWGGYRFGGYRSGTARAEQILVGTLVVDMVDASTKTIVWRGTAVKDIDVKAKPDKRDENINKAAAKIFKNYPPKS